MRLPRSWNDEDLLHDEPFVTMFAVRKEEESFSRRSRGKGKFDWNCITSLSDIEKDAGEAAQAWRKLAFSANSGEETSVRNIVVPADADALRLFIDFYWLLYKNHSEAEQFLLQERKQRGFQYVEGVEPKGPSIYGRAPGAPDSGLRAGPKPRRRGHKKCLQSRVIEDAYDAEVSQEEDDRSRGGGPQQAPALAAPAFVQSLPVTQSAAADSILPVSFVSAPSVVPEEQDIDGSKSSKRKATSDHPSSSSHSSSDEIPIVSSARVASEATSGAPFANGASANDDDLSSLSDLTCDELPNGDVYLAAYPALSVEANVAGGNRRQNPCRSASNRQNLTKMMEKEIMHQARLRHGILDISEEEREPVPLAAAGAQKKTTTKAQTRFAARKQKAKKAKVGLVGAPSAILAPPETATPQEKSKIPKAKVQPPALHPSADAGIGASAGLDSHSNKDSAARSGNAAARRRTRASRSTNLKAVKTTKKSLESASPEDLQTAAPPKKRRRQKKADDGGHATRPVPDTHRARRKKTAARPQEQADVQTHSPTAVVPVESEMTVGREMKQTTEVLTGVAGITSKSFQSAKRTWKRSRESVQPNDGAVAQPAPDKSKRITKNLPKRSARQRAHAKPPALSEPVRPNQPRTFDEIDSVLRDAASEARMHCMASMNTEHTSDWEGAEDEDEDSPELTHEEDRHASISALLTKLVSSQTAVPESQMVPETDESQYAPYRPPLEVQPPIWAQSRQELCESFDRFRSYQSGVYFIRDMVKGYLLSAFSSSRDIFRHDGRLIISHGGGKAESLHTKQGQSAQHEADDQQAEDKSVRALLTTFRLQSPVVLIIDDKYKLFPFDLASKGYSYVVLGYYHIAYAWAERQASSNSRGYVVRYKFAFKWCATQGQPWWISTQPANTLTTHASILAHVDGGSTPSQPESVDVASTRLPSDLVQAVPCPVKGQTVVHRCEQCNSESPLVYTQGWLCLNPNCIGFWRTSSGAFPPTNLTYSEDFIAPGFCEHVELEDLRPPPPATKSHNGVTTNRLFCKGWHCVQCGRLSSRYKWEHWECANCGITYKIQGQIRDPKEFWYQKPKNYMHHIVAEDSGIIVAQTQSYNYGKGFSFYHHYILPHDRGHIYLILGNPMANADANAIFKQYQEQATRGELMFRRWPLRTHKCRGALLTNYFSQNSGEPYQYVGGTATTVPWNEAPSAVRDARDLIQRRMRNALGYDCSFNEVLSAAYMEKQKMAFHSDSERGLGPTVAALSLGSAANMYFRLHSQYDVKTGKGLDRNALELFLRHGDVLVMEGDGIQTYYEHAVVPMNFRIAATARLIGPENH